MAKAVLGRKLRIGLLWHSARSGNLGVGALTVSNVALLREVCAELGVTPTFVLFGPREQGPTYIEAADVEVHDIDTRFTLSPRGFARIAGGLDCMLDIGAGDSFADIYGSKRFAFIIVTKMITLARRVPLMLSPQTFGPFDRALSRRLAAAMIDRSAIVVARDPLSRDVAAALSPKKSIELAIDVAFALPYDPAPRSPPGGPVKIGLNVSALLYNGGYAGGNAFGLDVDYAAMTDGFIERFADRPDCELNLFTHVVSSDLPMDDEGSVADRLAARYPWVRRVADFASPSEAKSFISGMDIVIAGRMHACIAAFSSGVPVVPVAYSRKFSGLFEGVLGYRYGVPVKGVSTTEAIEYLVASIDQRDDMAQAIAACESLIAERLDVYRGALRRFLSQVAA